MPARAVKREWMWGLGGGEINWFWLSGGLSDRRITTKTKKKQSCKRIIEAKMSELKGDFGFIGMISEKVMAEL